MWNDIIFEFEKVEKVSNDLKKVLNSFDVYDMFEMFLFRIAFIIFVF